MAIDMTEKIRSYYLYGYGYPVKYYTEANLKAFVKKKMITEEAMNEMIVEKKKMNE